MISGDYKKCEPNEFQRHFFLLSLMYYFYSILIKQLEVYISFLYIQLIKLFKQYTSRHVKVESKSTKQNLDQVKTHKKRTHIFARTTSFFYDFFFIVIFKTRVKKRIPKITLIH